MVALESYTISNMTTMKTSTIGATAVVEISKIMVMEKSDVRYRGVAEA